MQTRRLISILLSVFVLCSAVLYHQKQQFDYIYLDGYYYALTQEKLETRGTARGTAVGTIQRTTSVSSNQQSGDSNCLPVGAVIYSRLNQASRPRYCATSPSSSSMRSS